MIGSDVVPIGAPIGSGLAVISAIAEEDRPVVMREINVRVVLRLYDHCPTDNGHDRFPHSEWILTLVADRMVCAIQGRAWSGRREITHLVLDRIRRISSTRAPGWALFRPGAVRSR